jgi:hypothetical protein
MRTASCLIPSRLARDSGANGSGVIVSYNIAYPLLRQYTILVV